MFGSKFELTEKQTSKLNSLLPETLKLETFEKKDFDAIVYRMQDRIWELKNLIKESKEELSKKRQEANEKIAEKVQLFNCELQDAKALGMVDVGDIHKFASSTTGDRFAGGLVGYAIEMAIDDVWTKSSKQEESVNQVKLKLISKTLSIYPEANMIFNFDVDFRELGSTGSVFIYMRGTAAIGKNDLVDKAKKEQEKLLQAPIKELEVLQKEFDFCNENIHLLPENKHQIEEKLN